MAVKVEYKFVFARRVLARAHEAIQTNMMRRRRSKEVLRNSFALDSFARFFASLNAARYDNTISILRHKARQGASPLLSPFESTHLSRA